MDKGSGHGEVTGWMLEADLLELESRFASSVTVVHQLPSLILTSFTVNGISNMVISVWF